MLLHRVSLWLALAWMAGIFYLSHQPTLDMPSLFANQDKVMHFGAYGLLGILLLGAMPVGGVGLRCAQPNLRDRPNLRGMSGSVEGAGYGFRQVALATLIASLYGISDEFHQSCVPGRSPDVADWLADTAGALLATVLLAQVTRSFYRSRGLFSSVGLRNEAQHCALALLGFAALSPTYREAQPTARPNRRGQ
jgi:hypothetical protein